MIPLVWIYWVISLTIVTYASAYIVKRYNGYGFAALTAFYSIYLGASQILPTGSLRGRCGVPDWPRSRAGSPGASWPHHNT